MKMRFGIIGAGNIGSTISKKLVKNGHDVKIADARGIERLEGKELTGTPVSVEDVITNIDVLIISIPFYALPSIRHVVDKVGEEVVVVDTSNYAPFIRDNKIEEIENGMVESVWVSNQLGRPIIKAFNNLLTYTLENEGTPEGTSGRIAIAIAGNDLSQKQIIMDVVNELGFDTVDSGSLSDSWRHQPGTPAYCTELTKEELTKALKKANKEKAPFLRNKVIEKLSALAPAGYSDKDVVNIGREIYNS
jgi:predicted dinucleotide-binding enzyme